MDTNRSYLQSFAKAVLPAVLLGASVSVQAHHDINKPEESLASFENEQFRYQEALSPTVHSCQILEFERVSCAADNTPVAVMNVCRLIDQVKSTSEGEERRHIEGRTKAPFAFTRQDMMVTYLGASMKKSGERLRILDSQPPSMTRALNKIWAESNGDRDLYKMVRENLVENIILGQGNPNVLDNWYAYYTMKAVYDADKAITETTLDCVEIGARADQMVEAALDKLQKNSEVKTPYSGNEAVPTKQPSPEPMTLR